MGDLKQRSGKGIAKENFAGSKIKIESKAKTGAILGLVFGVLYALALKKDVNEALWAVSYALLLALLETKYFLKIEAAIILFYALAFISSSISSVAAFGFNLEAFEFSLVQLNSILQMSKQIEALAIVLPIFLLFYANPIKSKNKEILKRKLIHTSISLYFALCFAYFSKALTNVMLVSILNFAFIVFNASIMFGQNTPILKNFIRMFGAEEFTANGKKAIWLISSLIFLSAFFNSKAAAVTAVVIGISDTLASFGYFFQNKKNWYTKVGYNNKTFVGSAMFFFSSFAISANFMPVLYAAVYSAAVTFTEAVSKIDDNFSIAFVSGVLLSYFAR